jgi:hypothetical protein
MNATFGRAVGGRQSRQRLICKCALLVLSLLAVAPAAFADDAPAPPRDDRQWGISVWGVSYHLNRGADYNEDNWGLGVRYYGRPHWKLLGKNPDNRIFVEGDALRNSNGGLVLPVSTGVEYRIGKRPAALKVFAVGALTLAYYEYPAKHTSEIKAGPVPGVAVGYGRVKVNVWAVLRKSSSPLAATIGSMTIAF